MKAIALLPNEIHPAKELIGTVCKLAPTGATVDEIRRRMKVLDALDKAEDALLLEDADYELLRKLYNAFQFSIAHRDILAVADAIATANAV